MRRRIFINYRRDDSRAYAGWLYERLLTRFPNWVFRDVTSLEPGMRWSDAITNTVSQANVCIAVIGPEWLSIRDEAGRRRLDNPDDNVRQEILIALQHGVKMIPVLVGGAEMPHREELPAELRPICDWQAIVMTEQNWDDCCHKLIRGIEDALGVPHLDGNTSRKRSKVPMIASVSVIAALLIAGGVYQAMQSRRGGTPIHETSTDRPSPKLDPSPVSDPVVESAPSPVGSWSAIVTMMGQRYDDDIQLFSDGSFGVTYGGMASAVGSWESSRGNTYLEFLRATNIATNGGKFSCQLKKDRTGGSYSGACVDRLNVSATISMTQTSADADPVPDIPRVDTSSLTMGERTIFAAVLATQPCTCGCRYLTLLRCLREDRTCPISPGAAAASLAAFKLMTRS